MQELLGRIAALDPTASLGLRVIACFDELMVGNVNIHGLLATAAALAGCPAGCSHGSTVIRVSVLGESLTGPPPAARATLPVDTGGQVWLERDARHTRWGRGDRRGGCTCRVVPYRTHRTAALRRTRRFGRRRTLWRIDTPSR